jgi:predicted RNA-binding protein with PUA-like domain
VRAHTYTHTHRQITLEELKSHKEGGLSGMALFRQSRLSVQPVSAPEWDFILSLEAGPAAAKGEARRC